MILFAPARVDVGPAGWSVTKANASSGSSRGDTLQSADRMQTLSYGTGHNDDDHDHDHDSCRASTVTATEEVTCACLAGS